MKHYITINDDAVLSMDEATGDITLPSEKLPPRLNSGEPVQIRYREDSDGVFHEYVIDKVEPDVVYLKWVKQLKEEVLTEAPVVKLDDADLVDPPVINFRDKIAQGMQREREAAAAAEKNEFDRKQKEKYNSTLDKLTVAVEKKSTNIEILDLLFDELVPPQGNSDSKAGELVRAIMRILYRDSNDGDKFFEGYGIETCGSSAMYLYNNGFNDKIQDILNDAYQLADDDDKYTERVVELAEHVVLVILDHPELIWEYNNEDSLETNTDYIVENQPRYEFEIPGSEAIVNLVESNILTSWDLNSYVEDRLADIPACSDAEVSRPWGHHDTSVTVENLTRDAYEYLKDTVTRNVDAWWEDLTSEYVTDIDSDDIID